MATELQIAASRNNGARSQGPVTIEGKARSSRNAVRHGLTAKTVVLNNEDPAQFKILCENLANDYEPQTEYEQELVGQLAGARWKLRRCNILEKGIFDKAVDEMRPTIQAEYAGADEEMVTIFALEKAIDSPQFKSLRRYMTQLLREERHASAQLEKLRRERPAPPEPEALAKVENAPARNEPAAAPGLRLEVVSSRNEPGAAAQNGPEPPAGSPEDASPKR